MQEQRPHLAPVADHLRSKGRGDDTMLIHMTPDEVNSLQGLAMAHGGSLTINPDTGLPEAGWLGKLLPTILGGVLAATGVGAPLAAGLVGLGSFAATGSLKQGLMAGLGAFGGAGLAGAAGLGGAISSNAAGLLGSNAGILGANMGAGALAPAISGAGGAAAAIPPGGLIGTTPALSAAAPSGAGLLSIPAATTGAGAAAANAPGFLGQFAAHTTIPGIGGIGARLGPALAGSAVLQGVSDAFTPRPGTSDAPEEEAVSSNYTAAPRQVNAYSLEDLLSSSAERTHFTPTVPVVSGPNAQPTPQAAVMPQAMPINPGFGRQQTAEAPPGFTNPIWNDPSRWAAGGAVAEEFPMQSGGHVFPAKVVSAYGNFNTDAGQQRLASMGGIPIRGGGDGVSDSIPARIDGSAPARVASGEVYFPPSAVKRMGGTEKLYALMQKAESAANRAKSGERVKGLA